MMGFTFPLCLSFWFSLGLFLPRPVPFYFAFCKTQSKLISNVTELVHVDVDLFKVTEVEISTSLALCPKRSAPVDWINLV